MSGKKFFLLCAVGLFLIASVVLYLRNSPAPAPAPLPQEQQDTGFPADEGDLVLSVYDGDTLTVAIDAGGQIKVRVLGIDAPEMSPEETCAVAARDEVRALVQGRNVRLLPDAEQGDKDRYGRSLRYVIAEGTGDLGGHLVEQGLARVYEEYPVKNTPQYLILQQDAQFKHKGIWGSGCS